jgi:hypothetical protein
MHTACQAAFVHGRVRQVAAAQLGLARATLIAGLRPEQAAAGAMTALTGAAQAVALADLLDDGAVARLTAGWVAAFGEL